MVDHLVADPAWTGAPSPTALPAEAWGETWDAAHTIVSVVWHQLAQAQAQPHGRLDGASLASIEELNPQVAAAIRALPTDVAQAQAIACVHQLLQTPADDQAQIAFWQQELHALLAGAARASLGGDDDGMVSDNDESEGPAAGDEEGDEEEDEDDEEDEEEEEDEEDEEEDGRNPYAALMTAPRNPHDDMMGDSGLDEAEEADEQAAFDAHVLDLHRELAAHIAAGQVKAMSPELTQALVYALQHAQPAQPIQAPGSHAPESTESSGAEQPVLSPAALLRALGFHAMDVSREAPRDARSPAATSSRPLSAPPAPAPIITSGPRMAPERLAALRNIALVGASPAASLTLSQQSVGTRSAHSSDQVFIMIRHLFSFMFSHFRVFIFFFQTWRYNFFGLFTLTCLVCVLKKKSGF
jgi:hypothetical protein